MADNERDAPQRRVYVLPSELVERITAFQNEKRLPSEVEAVRRLLDEALKQRDTGDAIVQRMVDRVKMTPIPSDAARDILIGHPLLESLAFDGEAVTFKLKNFGEYRVAANGTALKRSSYNDSWLKWPVDIDDEIPF